MQKGFAGRLKNRMFLRLWDRAIANRSARETLLGRIARHRACAESFGPAFAVQNRSCDFVTAFPENAFCSGAAAAG
jgi:hypothetical protein